MTEYSPAADAPARAKDSIAPVGPAPVGPRRLDCLDALRGLVILAMFLVNTAGADPAFPSWFAHRGWNHGRHGQGLADFVFPWFLFVVGAAIPLSMKGGRGASERARGRIFAALRRSLTIYLLGTLLWCATIAYDPRTPLTWRVLLHWDILQLIALGYFVGVLVWLLPVWARVASVAGVLAWKWWIISGATPPGAVAADWPQRLTLQDWLRDHWGWAGTLVTQGLPSAATVVLGSLACEFVRGRWRTGSARSLALLAGGGCLVALSYAWHLAWREGLAPGMPYSKDYFTSSYVLLAAGSAAMILGLCHELCDARRIASLALLRIPGLNALALYIGAELVWKMVLMRWHLTAPDGSAARAFTAIKAWLQHACGQTGGAWLTTLLYIGAYWTLAWLLYRRRVFVRV